MNTSATTDVIQQPSSYPLLTDRVQSTFIDTVFIVIMMFVFAAALDKISTPPDWIRIALFFGLFGIYEPVCTACGCTIGNYIKGIRVRQAGNTSARINILQAFLRYVVKVALGWLSFVTIHFNPERRAIHDMIAGSVMIKV
jgi:uncharacterized RDD family membrane protein YckC